MSITLFKQGNLQLITQKTPDANAIKLLQEVVYGTSGVRYQQTDQPSRFADLQEPHFFFLYERDQLIGMYCLEKRPIKVASRDDVTAYYGRFLAVSQQASGQGYGHLLKQQAVQYIEQLHQNSDQPFLFYAYVESRNTRSMAIFRQAGFQSVAQLKTYFFRRLNPRKDPRFQPLTATELTAMKRRLVAYYGSYTFLNLSRIGNRDNYYVLKENGEIVAGVQANSVRWVFQDMPGTKGWFFMHIVPLIIRRLFNPASFQFITLEGLYLRHDRVNLLPVLLESLLAHMGLYSAMWEIDENDPHKADLKPAAMDVLSGFEKGVETHVMVKSVNMTIQHSSDQNPHYISCYDYS